jgi:hypothetical protein
MEVTYSAAVNLSLDQPVHDAQAERPGKPIRIRLQPTIFRLREGGASAGQQQAWAGVSWIIECQSAAEAIELREALRRFFDAVGRIGPAAVGESLADPSAA